MREEKKNVIEKHQGGLKKMPSPNSLNIVYPLSSPSLVND